MKPPFPWFSGKSRVACEVWEALGDGRHDTADDSGNAVNRHLERLWFSPSCLTAQRDLFAEASP